MVRGSNCILRGGGWRGGGVLGVVLIICMKWPPGVFSFEFGNLNNVKKYIVLFVQGDL